MHACESQVDVRSHHGVGFQSGLAVKLAGRTFGDPKPARGVDHAFPTVVHEISAIDHGVHLGIVIGEASADLADAIAAEAGNIPDLPRQVGLPAPSASTRWTPRHSEVDTAAHNCIFSRHIADSDATILWPKMYRFREEVRASRERDRERLTHVARGQDRCVQAVEGIDWQWPHR